LRASLALLASDKDGEVLAAAAAAKRLLDKAGLGFADLVPLPAPPPGPAASPWQSPAYPRSPGSVREHQHEAFMLLACGYRWDDWKRQFLGDIRQRRRDLTPLQADKLAECGRLARDWLADRGGTA
jgi:hypothetical protein